MRNILLLLVLILVPASDVLAQRVTLTPSVVQLTGTAGQSTTQKLTMKNETSRPLEFEMLARDVIVSNGKRTNVPAGDLPNGIAATAVFAPARVTIGPGESSSVNVTLTIPAGAPNRAVVVMFRGRTDIGNGGGRATASLGALFTFSLTAEHSLDGPELSVIPQSDTENAAFELALVNDGAEPETPKGVAVILDAAGAMIGKTSFEPRRLLPGERATFRTTYPGELPAGSYRVLSTFEYSGKTLTRTAPLVVD